VNVSHHPSRRTSKRCAPAIRNETPKPSGLNWGTEIASRVASKRMPSHFSSAAAARSIIVGIRARSGPRPSFEEQTVGVVVELDEVRIAELLEKCPEFTELLIRHFERGEHAPEIGPVIPVVEQADVPAATQRLEELHQRAGTLGKLE